MLNANCDLRLQAAARLLERTYSLSGRLNERQLPYRLDLAPIAGTSVPLTVYRIGDYRSSPLMIGHSVRCGRCVGHRLMEFLEGQDLDKALPDTDYATPVPAFNLLTVMNRLIEARFTEHLLATSPTFATAV